MQYTKLKKLKKDSAIVVRMMRSIEMSPSNTVSRWKSIFQSNYPNESVEKYLTLQTVKYETGLQYSLEQKHVLLFRKSEIWLF